MNILGMIHLFRRWLSISAHIVKYLGDILTNVKNFDSVLSKPATGTFHKIKSVLSNAIKLSRIVADKEVCLAVEVFSIAVGVVLQQKIDDQRNQFLFLVKTVTDRG